MARNQDNVPEWGDKSVRLPVQSMPITTKVVSLNPVHGKDYQFWIFWSFWFELAITNLLHI
jgi:hypothetical protein